MTLFARLQAQFDGLRAVDAAFAEMLQRLDPQTDPQVLTGAALASWAVGAGHAAFDPARPQLLTSAVDGWPDAPSWSEALQSSPWVGVPNADEVAPDCVPLVFENGLLYLRRYREYERRLAAGLRRIAASEPPTADPDALAALFAALFPEARAGDRQARAAALSLLRSLLLITGGPGTGKTATIARLLLLLIADGQRAGSAPLRIALAAPTGRAAERMAESLRLAAAQLHAATDIDRAGCDALPVSASTVHRLLGAIPGNPQFRHRADHPLPYDVIVIDEASMVDLPLMCKLVEAVADGARLILLGDRDQLPSVEAGDVLAAIVDAAGDGDALPIDVGARLAPLLGAPMPHDGANAPTSPLAGHRVELVRGYRQAAGLDLAPLAKAFREGDADTALALLRGGTLEGVRFHEGLHDPLSGEMREEFASAWRGLVRNDVTTDPATALVQAARVRLLTALRDGPQGAIALNARIEETLAGAQRERYFHGRLLLITENSYRHGLFNGDIGVCLRDGDAVTAWFAGGDKGVRGFHPAALPAHTGAFAMTVHKAQGSEFDTVWLQLPSHDARPLSRELFYTAVTRARHGLHVCASESVLRAALSRRAERVSGLAHRLVTA